MRRGRNSPRSRTTVLPSAAHRSLGLSTDLPEDAFIVTTGSDRRETGTHYTPKSLTETIVTETLTPIVYVGPAEGLPRAEWTLKSPAELLDLKICDPAMGSGAFLVQACRWLAERLVEAWTLAEDRGVTIDADGRVADAASCQEPLPSDTEARITIARRLIAERCLYGVDLNPLAVELAKLSIWLVTLAKGALSASSTTTCAAATACSASTAWISSPSCR